MKFPLFLNILFLIIVFSCNKQEIIPDNSGDPDEDTATCIKPVIEEGNIISDVRKTRRYLELCLENKDIIAIPVNCIEDYNIYPEKWKIELEYTDSTVMELPYLGNSFVIDKDSILVDPFGFAPLTATISFTLNEARKIRISVKSKSELGADISHDFIELKKHHTLPVFGLYADYKNTVEVSLLDYHEEPLITREIFIDTEPYERVQSGDMIVMENNYSPEQKNRLFLIQNAIYDGNGDVRWYADHGGQKYYKLSNGLIGIQAFPDKAWIGEGPDIKIINMLGEIVDTFDVPHRMHHEIIEKKPGGNLLVATNAEPYETIEDDTEDMIIEIDRENGEIVKEWDLREIFDPERERIWTENINDWCHLNSIEYDSNDNTLLISSKLQYFISKIDYSSGEIKWICGNHENWKEPWQKYLLTPVNFDTTEHVDQDWPYAQHMPRLTGYGTFIVYDNGVNRPGTDYTRAIEYNVVEEDMSVEKVWTYDLPDAARSLGSVQMYEDRSVQIGHGRKGEILEVSRQKELLFKGKLKSFYRSYSIRFYENDW